jgi:hypothetical protein
MRQLIVNPGSVGQSRSGDARTSYAIWDDGEFILRKALPSINDNREAKVAGLQGANRTRTRRCLATRRNKKDRAFLDRLINFVATLADIDEGEDEDGDGDDDRRQIRVGKDTAVDALTRAIRGKARARALGRALNKDSRNGRVIEWLGDRGVPIASSFQSVKASSCRQPRGASSVLCNDTIPAYRAATGDTAARGGRKVVGITAATSQRAISTPLRWI